MKVYTHKRKNLDQCLEVVDKWDLSKADVKKIKEYLKEYMSGRITKKRGTNPDGLVEALTNLLKVALLNINDPEVKKEIDKFYDDLFSDKIRAYNRDKQTYTGEKYSLKHKVEIISVLKRYLGWRYPDKPILTKDLDIRVDIKKSEPDFLSVEEIDRLYSYCKSAKERYIVSALFSSGARAEEFLNFRICDFDLK